MTETLARLDMKQRLCEAAERDERVVGLVDYGSGGQGHVDAWSDIDVAVILSDADSSAFQNGWIAWAAQFGEILLANRHDGGFPWTIYQAEPIPLRVDFVFYSMFDLSLGRFWVWPTDSASIQSMIWYDRTGGQLTAYVRRHLDQPKHSNRWDTEFERKCDYFWQSFQYLFGKLQRGEIWVARQVFHKEVLERLLSLLRLEAQAFDRWEGPHIAWNVEHSLQPERLAQLNACIPSSDVTGFKQSLANTAQLGYEVCTILGTRYQVMWPQALAQKMMELTVLH